MRIRITRGHCLGGANNDVYPGDVIDVDEKSGQRKIKQEFALQVPDNTPLVRNTPRPVVSQEHSVPVVIAPASYTQAQLDAVVEKAVAAALEKQLAGAGKGEGGDGEGGTKGGSGKGK